MLIVKQEEAINKIQSAKATELADDEVRMLHQFSTRVFQDMARFAFWTLYSQVRAYNCISFKLSRIYGYMAELHSFSSFTTSRLHQLNVMLNKDLIALSEGCSQRRKAKTTVALTLSADNPKLQFLFDSLRANPPSPHTGPSLINDYDRAFELDFDHYFFFGISDDFKITSGKKERFSVHIKSHGAFRYDTPTRPTIPNG